MNIDAEDFRTKETDDRGRIYLGTDYANRRVTVAVIDAESDPEDDELAAAYRDAAESAETLAAEWEEASVEAWDGLEE
jgi:hypothetical protein